MRPAIQELPRRAAAHVGTLLESPATMLALGAILAVCAFQLWITPDNPPGFFRDEASMALDASTLSTSLRDSNGALLPLYVSTFEDYFSPVFVYTLAAVFRVTGPHAEVARGLSAAGILAAVLLLGLLAYRRTGDRAVGVVTLILAGTTPWLFEVGRLAFEVGFEPLVIVLLLLTLDRAAPRFRPRNAILLGLTLGLLVYVYAAGRLLGPLYAAALVVYLSRDRLRWLLTVWATFAITLSPIALYSVRHPGALSARFHATTFIDGDDSLSEILRIFSEHAVSNLTPWAWLAGDDTAPRHHIAGAPAILVPLLALAAVGLVAIVARRRSDLFYRFALLIFVLSVVPASLTGGTHHALRLVPLPVLLVVIAIPGIELLVGWARRSRSGRVVAGLVALVMLAQLTHFIVLYQRDGPNRLQPFEAAVPALLAPVLLHGGRIYVDYDDLRPQAHARWFAAEHSLPDRSVVVLPDGGVPPPGSWVFGRNQECDFRCVVVERADDYWLARRPLR